jgi:hypothetical protein
MNPPIQETKNFKKSIIDPGAVLFDAGTVLFTLENAILETARTFAVLAACFFHGRAVFIAPGLDRSLDGIEQAPAGKLAVHGLRAGILHGHGDARGTMA